MALFTLRYCAEVSSCTLHMPFVEYLPFGIRLTDDVLYSFAS